LYAGYIVSLQIFSVFSEMKLWDLQHCLILKSERYAY
jgi:hypothetical protein